MIRTLKIFPLALLLIFAAAVPVHSQSLGLSPIFSTTDQQAFDGAYRQSLPPDLIAYMALPYNAFTAGSATAPTRTTPAILLQMAGKYALDTQIAVWGWDPYMTMLNRITQGYAWVPGFGQPNIPIGPGLSQPGIPYVYNPAAPPAGSIIMPAVNPATGTMALPLPYVAPVVAPPVVTTDPVGFLEMPFGQANGIGDWYSVVTGDTSPLGTLSADARGTFQKETEGFANVAQPGQLSIFWVKIK